MQVSHSPTALSVSFDEPNLVSAAGLVPVMRLARDAGLHELADDWLSVPTDKGANAGLKVASLVGGMVAGADNIDDMAVLRHGGMRRLFDACYAPSTLGSFLRSFTFGHVRQLDAVASRFLVNLASRAPLLRSSPASSDFVFVDVDDTFQSRFMDIRSRAPGTGTPGFAGSTPCWLSSPLQTLPRLSPLSGCARARQARPGAPNA